MTSVADFTIIVPVFNREGLLETTLTSVKNQSLPTWECIVVDDQSTDRSASIAHGFARDDSRFVVVSSGDRGHEPRGANACRNIGVRMARIANVVFLDSDDALHPDCLKSRRRFCQDSPDLDFLVFAGQVFKSQPGDTPIIFNVPTPEPDLDRFLASDDPWQTSHVVWRCRTLQRLGDWDESLPSWQDWEYNLRALLAGATYRHWYIADSYWRMPSSDRGSIGSRARSLEHLRRHRALLASVVRKLQSQDLLSQNRRRSLAQRHFRLVQRYVNLGYYEDAREVWEETRKLELIQCTFAWEFTALSQILERIASPAASNRWLRRWAKLRGVFAPNRIGTIPTASAVGMGVRVLPEPPPTG
jgi:glycosyltransferase involved in cell wall biosynthesis